MNADNDDWDKRYKKWEEEKNRKKKLNFIDKTEKKIEKTEKKVKESAEKVIEEIKEFEENTLDYLKEPKHIKVFKIIALVIPFFIIGYLIYSNFIANQEFTYFYDIGSPGERYLTPINRVSDIVNESPDYRNLTSNLVYFEVPIARNANNLMVEVKFKDYFPNGSSMSIGAKDQEVWHYNYHSIYNLALNKISEFPKRDNVYLVNPKLYILNSEELRYERNIVVATDKPYNPIPNVLSDYEQKQTIINSSLRGGHTAYIYIGGNLNLEVKKQDINWYNESDELEISVYDLENNLVANITIEDDGITEIKNKETSKLQEGVLQAKDLKEGVYKVEFKDFDGLIKEIKINTNKIVFPKVFLADNDLYKTKTRSSSIYTTANRNESLQLLTYHKEGIQNITYAENKKNKTFNFYQEDTPLYLNLSAGEFEFNIPKNDIIVSGLGYLAFSKENYFEPFKQRFVGIRNDIEWLKKNVDYIITDYKLPIRQEDWLIAKTEFNIDNEQLFIKDNKLSLLFNVPHLSQENLQNYSISIDWIKINVYKPGVFEK